LDKKKTLKNIRISRINGGDFHKLLYGSETSGITYEGLGKMYKGDKPFMEKINLGRKKRKNGINGGLVSSIKNCIKIQAIFGHAN
jgi:hypothetical protein